jgi:uncharacterized protein YchJ
MHEKVQDFWDECPCGSGKFYGACCGRLEPCPCGSGYTAVECCFSDEEEEEEDYR